MHSSNNSQFSQLINNIEEGLDNKRKMSSPFIEDINLFGNSNVNNSTFIQRIEGF